MRTATGFCMRAARLTISAAAVLMIGGPARMSGQIDVSKSGSAAATFLEIPVGARAIGMGGAFVSCADDATSLYWNPAGAALSSKTGFIASHTDWIAGTKFDFAGLAIPLGLFGTIGASFTSLSVDDMKVRTVEQPEGTGEYFSAGDLAAGITWARRMTDRFSIGFTAKYIHEAIWHESANAFALDAGTWFQTDLFGGMTIGATIANFGTKMQMAGIDARQYIRVDPSKTGTSDQIPSGIEMDSWDLPLLFQFGVSTNVLRMENYRWAVSADALHPSDDHESVNLGTEFSYQDFVFLRAGYQSLLLDQAEGGFSAGVGVASGHMLSGMAVTFDYGYRDMGRLESIHVFSVGAQF